MENQTKVILLVAAALFIMFLIYRRNNEAFEEEGSINTENNNVVQGDMVEEGSSVEDSLASDGSTATSGSCVSGSPVPRRANAPLQREDMIRYFPQKDYAPPEDQWLHKKFNSRNKARGGDFKRSSFSGARRGNLGPSNWDDDFDRKNNIICNSQTGENDKFLPIDESGGGFAVFKSQGRATCGSNQNCEPEDLFDVDKYLPQEVNDDWFEVQPEPISVKNRHLINITKPIGVNTIGTSLRNSSYDLRSQPMCPKFATSPWLNSSIEADNNLKPVL